VFVHGRVDIVRPGSEVYSGWVALVTDAVATIERLIQRDRLWLALGLALAVVLSWAYLVRETSAMDAMHAATGMAGMNVRAWGASDWLALFIMWAVMMVGMMLPSAAPVILLVLGAYRLRGDSQARLAAVAFIGGYVLVWTAFSVVASLGQLALHRAAVLSDDMRLHSAALSGGILLLAGIYEWLPIKNRCLARCQAPLAFLTQHWRKGTSGGLVMGLRHGTYCVGCCWLLMTMLFVLGVMNLMWIGALTMVVLLEKLASRGLIAGRVIGAVAAVWGVYLLAGSL
jgi:predicted metal-binding membrane protein